MFSCNDRISGRQVYRLLTYDLLGLGTLLVPTALAQTAGRDGIFCIGIGVAAALLYLKLLEGVLREMEMGSAQMDFPGYLEKKCGRFFGNLFKLGYVIYFTMLAGFVAYQFTTVIRKNLLREESFLLILFILILLTAYGLSGGLESRARVYELLFWFVMAPLFLMLFSAMDEICVDYWAPVFTESVSGVGRGAYIVFGWLAPVFLVLFLKGRVEKRRTLVRAGRSALIFAGILYAVLYLILSGIFGTEALSSMEYPAITMMSTVKITGGFLKRTDAFMLGIWFFTLYALLGSVSFHGGNMLYGFFQRENAPGKGGRLAGYLILAAAFVLAEIFYRSMDAVQFFYMFFLYIGTPFVILVPVLLRLSSRTTRKLGVCTLIVCLPFLSGCSTAELEDRSFPLELAVEDTDDFGMEWLGSEQAGSKTKDYGHLKVIIFSEDFLEDENKMNECLKLLEEKADVPRNTYVLAAKDPAEILSMPSLEDMDSLEDMEGVGTYLEQYIENVSQMNKKFYPTLGMLYQEQENHLETLFIPVVEQGEEYPVINGYYAWVRGNPAGETDAETVLLSAFTAGETKDYTIRLFDDSYIRLFDAKSLFTIENQTIHVKICCDGEILLGEENKTELEKAAQIYLNQTAKNARKNSGIDVTGSYKKLGGLARSLYFLYRDRPDAYEQEMEISYELEITWVNR